MPLLQKRVRLNSGARNAGMRLGAVYDAGNRVFPIAARNVDSGGLKQWGT